MPSEIHSKSPKSLTKFMFELVNREDGKGVDLVVHVEGKGRYVLFYFGVDRCIHRLPNIPSNLDCEIDKKGYCIIH